ncbi:MAG: exosortase C-terminal domain/associated protein EpsI [Terriglobia bacterium]
MNSRINSWLRFLVVVVLFLGASVFIHDHTHAEEVPPHQNLALFPAQIGNWTGTDVAISEDARAVLGPGEFLERLYANLAAGAEVDLFLAYFPTQRSGDTIHSPKNCLPGAGWTPIASNEIHIPWGNGKQIVANRYILTKGLDREVVLYWYESHGRAVASEYWAKYYLIEDAIRLNRTDGALVRVITPVAYQAPVEDGVSRAVAFAQDVLPLLGPYIPR